MHLCILYSVHKLHKKVVPEILVVRHYISYINECVCVFVSGRGWNEMKSLHIIIDANIDEGIMVDMSQPLLKKTGWAGRCQKCCELCERRVLVLLRLAGRIVRGDGN